MPPLQEKKNECNFFFNFIIEIVITNKRDIEFAPGKIRKNKMNNNNE